MIKMMNQSRKPALVRRDLSGILLLDKPTGITSNTALQIVKRRSSAKKAGHTGTLDPLASGMLPICFGEATKIIRFLLDANKTYRVKIALGTTMTTGDAQGEVMARHAIPELSLEEIESILANFRGAIQQIPPIYSALKQNGKCFYELARQGRGDEINLKPRSLTIHSLIVERYEYHDPTEAYLSLTVRCSKGTYIRSLAHDIGVKMGCGAHVLELRRTSVEPFGGYPMITMDEINNLDINALDALLWPCELAIPHIPKMVISELDYVALYHGKSIPLLENMVPGWVQLWCESMGKSMGKSMEQFFGVGEALSSGLVVPRRLFKTV